MELRVIPIAGCGGLLLTLTLLETMVAALDDPVLSPLLFYPFGPDVGDSIMTPNDDGSTGSVKIDVGFPFFATSNTELFVNTNGAISFELPVQTFTPERFPVAHRMIAPYWCDIDTTRNNGRVYYRQSTDSSLLNRATQDVLQSFASRGLYFFKAKWIFIATWHNVTYYGGSASTPINSFQAVLITDGKHSMAMFNYGWISWTTGTSSGGDGATGLGGTAAQVGFNAGDNVNFFAVPGSRESSIVQIAENSNVGLKGRWLFRIDSATIEVSSSCETKGKCAAHQIFDEKTRSCSDVAPAFKCPTLEGPEVISRRWIEFYCTIPTNETSADAAFNVSFLFNGEPSNEVPSFIVRPPEQRATLHEKHLSHKLLGKWISCRAFSFWSNAENARKSQTMTSTNSYWAGIEVSPHVINVREGDPNPAILTLKSTLPITCRRESFDSNSCDLTLRFSSTKDILIRGRDKRACSHTLTEADWRPEERKAYRSDERIEVFAKIDYIVSGPRYNSLTIAVSELPPRFTADGERYISMWSKYSLPEIMVYHYDIPQSVCGTTGDPNLTTFDRLRYSAYASGQFTYVQTTSGPPVEVQVRHKPCGPTVSCICGVAVRENNLILVADKCTNDILHTVTFSDVEKLPRGVGIFQNSNGRSFEMVLPSKVRVLAYVFSWRLTTLIYSTSREYRRTEGLCGLFDGNPSNDLRVKGANQTEAKRPLAEIIESWRLPAGLSLFDGVPSKLNEDETLLFPGFEGQTFCNCQGLVTDCGLSVVDNSLLQGDKNRNQKNSVKRAGRYMNSKIESLRRRRDLAFNSSFSRTDDIDWEYDGMAFFYNDPKYAHRPANVSWPTWNGITEEAARAHCYRVLWTENPVRAICEKLVDMSDVNGVISKCLSDIKMTGDLSWADDKIPEIQNLCIFDAVTANITERNTTIEELTSLVQDITAFICLPQDCSGHGTCRNGTCICDKGYVGSDCALAEDVIPKIVRTLGLSSCDLDRFPCQKIEMVIENVTSLPTLVCKVDFVKTQTFKTSASMETLETASCELPTDVLQGSLRFLRTNSSLTTVPPDAEPSDIYSLPQGNPVLHYSISISNNGRSFSNSHPLTVYDSRCYSCDGQSCSRKNDTCLINGYCFASSDINPFNPECDSCEPTVSPSSWTKLPDPLCDPCRSSPCVEGSICKSKFKGKYTCIGRTYDRTNIILLICLAILVAIVIVVVVSISVVQYRKRKAYESPSEGYEEMQDSGGNTEDMRKKLVGSNF